MMQNAAPQPINLPLRTSSIMVFFVACGSTLVMVEESTAWRNIPQLSESMTISSVHAGHLMRSDLFSDILILFIARSEKNKLR